MFYFQTLLNQALGGIDGSGIIAAVVNVAYGILLVGFLVGLYQAVMRGGDVQALGVTAIKYLVVAIIIANWSTVFHDVNNSFNSVAQYIGQNSGDVFLSWDKQLGQQFSDSSVSWWDIISGDIAALISVFLIVIAYIFYIISIVLFCFFYTLYGAILYVVGPLIMAFLPMGGVGDISKSFARNVMIWNAWGIIYAIFGALITAIHLNQISDGFGSFMGFLEGPIDSIFLGMISIFYAISIAFIPVIASRIISGDVGATAVTLVRAAGKIAGVGVAAVSGAVAGASSAAAASGAGSSSSGASATGASAGGTGAASGAASSSPPPTPGLGQSIRAGLASVASSNTSPAGSSAGTSGAAGGTNGGSGRSGSSRNSGGSSRSREGSRGGSRPADRSSGSAGADEGFSYRPVGAAQQLAYQGAKALTRTPKDQANNDD